MTRILEPRWQTPLPHDVVGSWGPAVTAYAETVLGIRLDRWQRRAINRALAIGASGRLIHRHYLISTARQNGKTAIVRAIIGWALTYGDGPEWRAIAGLAHAKRQAGIPYRAVLEDLRPVAARVGPASRAGLSLTRYLGIRSGMYGRPREYHTFSREARDALRGETTDLGLFDEVRTQRDYETWAALEPTTTARPEPLILATSTAGDDRSVVLRDWFDRGLRIIDGVEPFSGFGMTWYAAADDVAPDSALAIRQANPSIAEGRIDPAAVAASFYGLTTAAYRSERLNLWTAGEDEWLPSGTWPRQAAPAPADRLRVVLGIDATPTWRRATVAVTVTHDAGAWIGVAGELDAARLGVSTVPPDDLGRLVVELIRVWKPDAIAYSASSAAAPYAAAAAASSRTPAHAMTAGQVKAASELFRSELVGGRLTHAEDAMLAQQARSARPSGPIEGGDWYLSIRQSAGEIDGIRAAAWSSWAAIAPPPVETVPQVFV